MFPLGGTDQRRAILRILDQQRQYYVAILLYLMIGNESIINLTDDLLSVCIQHKQTCHSNSGETLGSFKTYKANIRCFLLLNYLLSFCGPPDCILIRLLNSSGFWPKLIFSAYPTHTHTHKFIFIICTPFTYTNYMNHIALFPASSSQPNHNPHSNNTISNTNTNTNTNMNMNKNSSGNGNKINSKRPQMLTVSRSGGDNRRWSQCKIIGKNISIRSYCAACAFRNKLYIYGGYQMLKGMMSDFYCIDLDDKVERYTWEQIQPSGQVPGTRSKHALIGARERIYLVGGLINDVSSSNQIFQYNPDKKVWGKMKPDGEELPEIDSFGCVYVKSGEEEKIIMICGYDGKNAIYLNSVYEYNITKNKISKLFQGTKTDQGKEGQVPIPRSGCAAASDGKNVYVFGGKDSEHRMNDLWEFSLTDFKYKLMDKQGDVPPERNGHTMEHFEGKLYVFGGIHDITWELDDLHIYSLTKKKWTTLEQDSPRKVERKKATIENASKQKQQKKSPKRKNWYETVNTLYNNNKSFNEGSPSQKNYQTSYNDEQQNNQSSSPGKMIDEQRKKAFLQRKQQMLKNFEVQKSEQNRYLQLETSSQAMKNSLDVIGDPDPRHKVPQGRLTDFGKQSASKFLQPLQNNSNLIQGKKPCARDGHCSAMIGDELIILGGDRHQMSFNDIFKLHFKSNESDEQGQEEQE